MSEQVINADPEELSIIEDFFRIHFCATPDILEETLPQLSSIKQNLKLLKICWKISHLFMKLNFLIKY